jgi:hypothetical protein
MLFSFYISISMDIGAVIARSLPAVAFNSDQAASTALPAPAEAAACFLPDVCAQIA